MYVCGVKSDAHVMFINLIDDSFFFPVTCNKYSNLEIVASFVFLNFKKVLYDTSNSDQQSYLIKSFLKLLE